MVMCWSKGTVGQNPVCVCVYIYIIYMYMCVFMYTYTHIAVQKFVISKIFNGFSKFLLIIKALSI